MTSRLAFSRVEYQRRMQQVEVALEQAGFDALIAYSVKNQPGPVAYLGGYEPNLGLHDVAFFAVVPNGHPRYALLTNAFWDNPQQLSWPDDIIITSDYGHWLSELLPGSVRRIGVAGYRFFPTPVYTALQAAFPAASIVDATTLLMEVAKVKSPEEVQVIRRCWEITDEGGRAFLASIHEGANEREIKAEVERAVMLGGSDGMWYNFQIYSGSQVAVGIGLSKDRTLARGEQVQVDCGAHYRGYHGDLSRVTTVGPASDEIQAIMETTANMYEAMLQAIRPGAPVADIARAAIHAARKREMEPYLYHSPNHAAGFVGHGIGCWYHEYPEIHPDATDVLETNMVIVLEPILGRPGVGGAKIEDAVLVTPQGAERLSSLDIRTWPA